MVLREFHVNRGVTLPRFETPTRLRVSGEPRHDGRAFELRDERDVLRYRARVPATHRPLEPAGGPPRSPRRTPRPFLRRALYSPGHLFHGPRFQVVQAAGAFSRRAARATILGTLHMAWPAEAWLTDPAALDGALQTAFLVDARADEARALPLAIAEVVASAGLARRGAARGPALGTIRREQ